MLSGGSGWNDLEAALGERWVAVTITLEMLLEGLLCIVAVPLRFGCEHSPSVHEAFDILDTAQLYKVSIH